MVDIVVFPECGLYDCQQMNRNTVLNSAVHVPSSAESIIPCRYPNAEQVWNWKKLEKFHAVKY